ncbi:hypothetical protein NDI45_24985 [Leptolyngbya sp. GB1-A1]|uniref:hypothetical protein n=1 Tax=Leptolyngbya sp. GB1-A1 TaxID=2933908 RepID=UPI0032983151
MGKFADRLAWLMGWDILGVEPHKCHSTGEWAARLSLPSAAEFEVQRIAQEQERQARQPQLSPNGSDRPQLPVSGPTIADPTADTEDQLQAMIPIQCLPLSLVDLLEAMLEQQSGELLLSQVEAIVSKPRFQQVFPHLGQVDRAALIAAFRQLESQGVGKVSFLTAGQAVLKHNSIPVKTSSNGDRHPLSKPAQIILSKVKNKNVQHEWLDAKWVKNYIFYTKELRQYSPDQIREFLHELAAAGKGVVEGEGRLLRWCFEPNRESSTQN